MHVFSDDFVAALRSQHERLPRYQRELIYHVATNAWVADVRAEVEGWVAALPSRAQNLVIPRLRTSDKFRHTYHELAVGHLLGQLGHAPEYERPCADGAPDWYVPQSGHLPAFSVEVFTAEPPLAVTKRRRAMDDLAGRIGEIRLGLALHVDYRRMTGELTSKDSKRIAREVRAWLEGGEPRLGAALTLDGIEFEIVHFHEDYSSVRCLPSGGAFMVDLAPLRGKIDAKAKKYAAIGIPLVVAVVADFSTGYGLDSLVDVLLGHETVTVTVREPDMEIVGQRWGCSSDGLFHSTGRQALSAGMWAWHDRGEWRVRAIHNPHALHPLPPDTFGEATVTPG